MPPVGFEPTIPASARPQTYALDRAATGIGDNVTLLLVIKVSDEGPGLFSVGFVPDSHRCVKGSLFADEPCFPAKQLMTFLNSYWCGVVCLDFYICSSCFVVDPL
jgi:hypothetical protein